MPTKYSNNRYSAAFKTSIMSLNKTGRSASSWSKEYNVSVSTVIKWINQDNFQARHRITNILRMLKVPRSTYYGYRHWQPSKTACRRQLIKQQRLSLCLKYPMHGYSRLTVAFYQILDLKVSQWLVYHLMKKLGMRSRMVRRIRKPKIHPEYPQRPNLIKDLADQTRVLVTDITYIPFQRSWLYFSQCLQSDHPRVIAYNIGSEMTQELVTTPVIIFKMVIYDTDYSHLFVRNLNIRAKLISGSFVTDDKQGGEFPD